MWPGDQAGYATAAIVQNSIPGSSRRLKKKMREMCSAMNYIQYNMMNSNNDVHLIG